MVAYALPRERTCFSHYFFKLLTTGLLLFDKPRRCIQASVCVCASMYSCVYECARLKVHRIIQQKRRTRRGEREKGKEDARMQAALGITFFRINVPKTRLRVF